MRKTSGISLMLLIFLSLCLITFSLLSLSGANADQKLSSKAADRTTEYYAAVSETNRQLGTIDTQLAEYLREAAGADEPEAVWQELCAGLTDALPDISWVDGSDGDSTDDTGSESDVESGGSGTDEDCGNSSADEDCGDSGTNEDCGSSGTDEDCGDSGTDGDCGSSGTDEKSGDSGSGAAYDSPVGDIQSVSFAVAVNDSQILLVTLELSYPGEDGDTLYRITTWKTVNTQDWTAGTIQNLLQISD